MRENPQHYLLINSLKGYLTSTTIYPTIKHTERENNLFEKI